jgi:hypothetical protein
VTPPVAAVPGITRTVLAPMLAMVRWMAMDEPLPISIIAITAAMPMTMPSVVSTARVTFRRSARKAVFRVRNDFTSDPQIQVEP